MKKIFTYNVKIWVGLREKYTNEINEISKVENICQKFCDEIGDCVSITKTKFIYKHGNENGVVIQWISYPRFPRTKKEIKNRAFNLAKLLKEKLNQYRISVETPNNTYLI